MSNIIDVERVDFVAYMAGFSANRLEVGKNAGLESLAADLDRRLVLATIGGRTRLIPFERVDSMLLRTAETKKPTGTAPTGKGKKNGQRTAA